MFKKIILLFCSFLLFISFSINAQQKELPSWVAMIDNSTTNYYEAVKVFDEYWKDKFIWDEEEEMFDKPTNKKEERAEEKKVERLKRELKKMSPSERQEYDVLKYHYKRFKTWARESFPFVQDDGRILTNEERIAIWEKQQQESR